MKTKLFTLLLAVAASVGTMFANQVWPIIMDETTFATCNSNSAVVADFRPNNDDRFLYLWDNTYDSLTTAGLNSMGNTDGYLSLRVSRNWAGAGFHLNDNGNSWQAAEQLRAAIVANPDNYYLHMAIKSTDNYSHCFYLFNTEATKFVLGNHSVYDGPVYSDFTRDGAWQEFYIPMSTYASALASVTYSTGMAIFVMQSEGEYGAMLDLDAVYICDVEFMNQYNQYSITTESSNPEWGTTAGDTTVTYMSEVEISAIPNYGYHFVRWNDGNTSNPRIVVSVTKDKTYTAIFAKNVYSITKNAAHGTISGNSSAEYLDEVTLTVNPDYGYHFTQWSDGVTDNPRAFILTQDTAFTAEFAVDKNGSCGDELALTWTYDDNSKELTISSEGSLNSNYTFGVEAPTSVETLIFDEGVTSVGNSAFANYTTLKDIYLASTIKRIYEQAFYNCENLENIYCYRAAPCVVYSDTFDGIDKFACTLHVPAASIDLYKAATGWRDFYYIVALPDDPSGIDQVDSSSLQGGDRGRLILRDGQVLIQRGEKVYNAQGALVK